MEIEIVKSSPLAVELAKKDNIEKEVKYPFEKLEVLTSFKLPLKDANESSLRTMCSSVGKQLGRKFRCIKHEDLGIIEVARTK